MTKILDANGQYTTVTESTVRILPSRPSEADRIEFSGWGLVTLGGAEEPDIDYFQKDNQ